MVCASGRQHPPACQPTLRRWPSARRARGAVGYGSRQARAFAASQLRLAATNTDMEGTHTRGSPSQRPLTLEAVRVLDLHARVQRRVRDGVPCAVRGARWWASVAGRLHSKQQPLAGDSTERQCRRSPRTTRVSSPPSLCEALHDGWAAPPPRCTRRHLRFVRTLRRHCIPRAHATPSATTTRRMPHPCG